MRKVFVIGLSKTGTTSLHAALERLGFRSVHNPEAMLRLEGDALAISPRFADDWDALSDLPVAAFFRELDAAFPGSRFILTTRDENAWLASCRNHFDADAFRPNAVVRRLVEKVYGTAHFDEVQFRRAYRRHEAEVRAHFEGRAADFRAIDLSDADKWHPLTSFLGVDEPDEPYPHENRASRVPAPVKKAARWVRNRMRSR